VVGSYLKSLDFLGLKGGRGHKIGMIVSGALLNFNNLKIVTSHKVIF
jgi:hypothetical protein